MQVTGLQVYAEQMPQSPQEGQPWNLQEVRQRSLRGEKKARGMPAIKRCPSLRLWEDLQAKHSLTAGRLSLGREEERDKGEKWRKRRKE